ncbi:MAG: class I SAM-dependent methyltransferase [Betaproteobacteria bacterium]|nr:class I SAM-dependent methyltransferase [Betaproteobacteria bacterium]
MRAAGDRAGGARRAAAGGVPALLRRPAGAQPAAGVPVGAARARAHRRVEGDGGQRQVAGAGGAAAGGALRPGLPALGAGEFPETSAGAARVRRLARAGGLRCRGAGDPRRRRSGRRLSRLDSGELARISAATLEHYEQRAEDFRAGTRDHDVSQNIAALLRHIEGAPPFTILDFGCGPGRDLTAFTALGHVAVGLEGSEAFAAMAQAESGCKVLRQDFLALELPPGRFDGVFANASLFHVPSQELPRVLAELRQALKPRGALFSSNPRGENQEGWNCGRYGVYHELQQWRGFMAGAGFLELEHYYRPAGLPRAQQPWLASVWRRNA